MKKEQIGRLLDHWTRPVHASELFRFSHVLVNNKAEETTAASYINSFAPTRQNETFCTQEGDAEDNDNHQPLVPNSNPTPPILDPNIDPVLQNQSYYITSAPTPPIVQPTRPDSSPPINPSASLSPVSLTAEPEKSSSQPCPRPKKTTKTPIVLAEPEQLSSQPRPRPKKTTKNAIVSSENPNPTSQQEEELGRPKRVQKRRVDLYLEAEQKTELAKKKRRM